ncbi:MAG: hypothetical protein FD173_1825 [Gallionellaceae bacterium]|nr:MAG: hypothetical protein FD173_1825 [Gallionellaceae bacterium]
MGIASLNPSYISLLHVLMKRMAKPGLILMMGVSISACSTSWKEEVQLHDGNKIIVKRSQSRGGGHEIGQEVPVNEHKIFFTLPGTHRAITWETTFGQDINDSNLIPLALDVINGTPYIATTNAGCIAYNKWGRPNPPYVFFKYDSEAWQRISLEEFPTEIKEANLVIGLQLHERRLSSHSGALSAEEVKSINAESRSSEVSYLRLFVREPMASEWCATWKLNSFKAPIPIPSGDSTKE